MYFSHIIVFIIALILSAFTTVALILSPVLVALALLAAFMALEIRLYVSDAKGTDNV